MRIGLPMALLHMYYRTFWRTFFSELGLEVVESGPTTAAIVNRGVKLAVPEICVPIKIYTGHVAELLARGVDLIYIPRLISIKRQDSFCPKFLALPDMLKATVPGLEPKLLTHHLTADTDNIATTANYLKLGKLFTSNSALIRTALDRGRRKWQAFRNLCCRDGYHCQAANEVLLEGRRIVPDQQPLKIGLLGYVYNIYDPFVSMGIVAKLRHLGAATVTFEMLQQQVFQEQLHHFPRQLFWTFSNKLLAAAYHFWEDPAIDGIIHVTAFGCGPDSFLGKLLELDSDRFTKPLMTIRVDEHSGENHLQTRIEAFVDLITKQKRNKGCA
ncbi:MAG: acyl-CoA dehydratase activase-related protein [Bacillota bacterium]|jgi:predicted nucleotide-binding protein (sugar kinase/HSP70/actin superfamily)